MLKARMLALTSSHSETNKEKRKGLSTNDGSYVWNQKTVQADTLSSIRNGMLYFLTPGGELDALRASDGSLLWHAPNTASGSALELEADHGLTYISAPDGGVDARRVTDGILLWHRSVKGNVMLVGKGIIYFSTDDGSIHAMRGSDGTLLWHRVLSISELTINETAGHD